MEATERAINEQESMDIIHNMILSAKKEIKEDGFLYLLWGWLVFATAISQYILIYMHSNYNGMPWMIMTVIGVLTSIVYGRRQNKTEKVKTYVDNFMKYIWISFGITLFITLTFMFKLGLTNTYPIVIMIYGIGTFLSGGALRFRPLIIGGICCWLICIAAFFVGFEVQLLLLALSVLVSYIIPGHILRAKYAS
jgi:hypothetical protein